MLQIKIRDELCLALRLCLKPFVSFRRSQSGEEKSQAKAQSQAKGSHDRNLSIFDNFFPTRLQSQVGY